MWKPTGWTRALIGMALLVIATTGCGDDENGATPSATTAAARNVHLGFLSASSSDEFVDALKEGLAEEGYVEGKNLRLDVRTTKVEDELPAIAAELVKADVDLIIAGGTKAVEAAKKATTTIPIVMTNSGDPVGSGLVASLAKPGGNVTGLTQISPDLSAKRIELLKEAFPSITAVGIVWNPNHSAAKLAYDELAAAASKLGIEVRSLEVQDAPSVEAAFQPGRLSGVGALVVVRDPLVVQQAAAIVGHAGAAKLPALYETRNFVDDGGLMLFGPNFAELYRRSAGYVGRVLRGADPAGLPIERPTKFEIVVNKRAATAAGISIPQSVLVRADDVIE